MPHISLKGVTKKFANTVAVDNVELEIEKGEIFSILGPSGCGKTTTLRIIAGLVYPDGGRVYVQDTDITDVPPEKRNIAMVFQDYALWPHMTVFDNIAFGLKLRKKNGEEIRKMVRQVLELVKLEGLERRYPTQLSGGQQQRVALARALALNPQAILFDEPLSNLDAKLREELRYELKTLLKNLGITAVYVTHDQLEGFTISDRIAVMSGGKIIQVGTPKEIYTEPINSFVATFIGESNRIEAKIIDCYDERVAVEVEDGIIILAKKPKNKMFEPHQDISLILRPESLKIAKDSSENAVECEIAKKTYLGDRVEYVIWLGKKQLKFRDWQDHGFEAGSKVRIEFIPEKIVLVDK